MLTWSLKLIMFHFFRLRVFPKLSNVDLQVLDDKDTEYLVQVIDRVVVKGRFIVAIFVPDGGERCRNDMQNRDVPLHESCSWIQRWRQNQYTILNMQMRNALDESKINLRIWSSSMPPGAKSELKKEFPRVVNKFALLKRFSMSAACLNHLSPEEI